MATVDDHDEEKASISISVINETAASKTILVLGRDHRIPLTPSIVDEAWQVFQIGSHGKVAFEYPEETAVGATYYREDGSLISIGPHTAKPGTTWKCELDSPYDDGELIQETKSPSIIHGVYMVYNKLPAAWSGRRINVCLYKGSRPLIIKKNARVGDYVELRLTDKLYFCCMEADSPSAEYDIDTFFTRKQKEDMDLSEAEFSPLMKLDLKLYPNGVNVTIQENATSGQILFIPKPCFG